MPYEYSWTIRKNWRVNELIDTVLLKLLLNNKIDYVKLSNLYTQPLKKQNKDKDNLLFEAESCALGHLFNIKKENKLNHNAIHRTLYLLNKSNSFMMNKLN
jgi:spore coat polysaccharide biosynthesis protein SpsF (cytidylyltransferase family)